MIGQYKDIVLFQNEIKHDNIEAIAREIDNQYQGKYILTDPQHFSDQYRNYCELVNVDKDEQIQKYMDALISKKFNVKSELDKIIIKNRRELAEIKRKDLLITWKAVMISAHMHLKNMHIDYEAVYNLI